MTEENNPKRREKFEEEAERIRNSDRGISETGDAIEEIREKYYNSKWEKMEEDIEQMADYKRYAFILGSGLIFALLAGFVFGELVAVIAGTIGVLAASAYMTKPGLRFMQNWEENRESGSSQKQASSSKSDRKVICSNCGWQNRNQNNYCNDCGEELSAK